MHKDIFRSTDQKETKSKLISKRQMTYIWSQRKWWKPEENGVIALKWEERQIISWEGQLGKNANILQEWRQDKNIFRK